MAVRNNKSDKAKSRAKIVYGAIFGKLSPLDGEPHAASYIALEDAQITKINRRVRK